MICKFENVADNGNLLPFQTNSYSKTKHDKQLRLRRRDEYMYVHILDPKRNKMIFANTQIQPKDWAYKPQVKNKFFACIITKAWISKEGICGHLGCKEGGGGGGLCIYRMFRHVSNSINIIICLKIFDTKFIKTITLTSAIDHVFKQIKMWLRWSQFYLFVFDYFYKTSCIIGQQQRSPRWCKGAWNK